MAEQMRPASPELAPDPTSNYERSHPGREAGLGRLDNDDAIPHQCPDKMEQAVKQKQGPRQINAHEDINQRAARIPTAGGSLTERTPPAGASVGSSQPLPGQNPQQSMKDETPLGWDQAPTDIHNPRDQRQPRTGGEGGTP